MSRITRVYARDRGVACFDLLLMKSFGTLPDVCVFVSFLCFIFVSYSALIQSIDRAQELFSYLEVTVVGLRYY